MRKLLTILTGMEHAMGSRPPWYLGRAYYEPENDFVVLAPIPLNFLIGWGREAYYRLRRGPMGMDGLLEKARSTGFRSGLEAGKRQAEFAYNQAVRMEKYFSSPNAAGESPK